MAPDFSEMMKLGLALSGCCTSSGELIEEFLRDKIPGLSYSCVRLP